MYKVGDKVIVKCLMIPDNPMEIKVGDTFRVNIIRSSTSVGVSLGDTDGYPLNNIQIEKVEESKEMTFPEMTQKLIDGEFEVGTELENSYEYYEKSYWVHRSENTGNFGLSVSKYEDILKVELEGTDINGSWTAKEEIKEMSIEELQKELGYKIKIVE